MFSLVFLLVISPSQIPLVHVTPLQYSPLDLKQINDLVKGEVSGQQALDNVAYVYMGWRTTGGPWYNAVLDWIAGDLKEMGFSQGIQSDGDKYWMQEDPSYTGSIWDPKYASLEIVGPEGDDTFDFKLNTFDPTSTYYPQDITQDWIINNIGSTKEAAIGQRARLATNSGFTDQIGTTPEDANGINGDARLRRRGISQ